jgi:hypothetical protein
MISPNFPDEKLNDPSLEDLIDVFEDRIKWWVIEPACVLLAMPHGFVAAMCLLLTYFEGYAIYRRGEDSKGHSKVFFREGFRDVFRNVTVDPALLDRVSDVLYGDARCGFFHDGMLRERILFSEQFEAEFVVTVPKIDGNPDPTGPIVSILINPRSFCRTVATHFVDYVAELRDVKNTALRTNFKAAVDAKWAPDTAVPIGMSEDDFKRAKAT